MAAKQIHELVSAGALAGSDLLLVSQSGQTRRAPLSDLPSVAWARSGTGAVARSALSRANTRPLEPQDFGAVGDGVADDTAALQACEDAAGGPDIYYPAGTYRITDSITLKGHGRRRFGAGREASTILLDPAVTNKPALQQVATTYLRGEFENFGVSAMGTGCRAVAFDNATYECFDTSFMGMNFNSHGDALYLPNSFSTTLTSCAAWSTNGHGFVLEGGPGTTLLGCYAHQCGTGKAGYRIWGIANLLGCNGIDSGDRWGIFGRESSQDGANTQYYVYMTGNNVENWDQVGLEFRYTGSASIIRNNFTTKATGDYEMAVLMEGTQATIVSGNILSERAVTHTGLTQFQTNGASAQVCRMADVMFTERHTAGGLVISMSDIAEVAYVAFATVASVLGKVSADWMALTTQGSSPPALADMAPLWFDGSVLKYRLPDGTIKTITAT